MDPLQSPSPYRGYSCTVDTNKDTGRVYVRVFETYAPAGTGYRYHFQAPSLEAAEGAFHTSVDNYLLGRTPQPTQGYELHFTITGLPYPVKSVYPMATAQAVVELYLLPGNVLLDLKKAIAATDNLDIAFDIEGLWASLPEWLQGYISALMAVVDSMVPEYPSAPIDELGEYSGEREECVEDLLSRVVIEVPRQPLQVSSNEDDEEDDYVL